ncbi:RNA-binding protein [Marinitoga sp. 1135]|uniref:S1 RNA-binding domain-containing protein n=1 Tax=Marinitoga TaxID=160798 RepID=UPI000682E259|nr:MULTISPECIES: S1 RNA-binding domain-containing protein [unclassified Marinitoga]NUU96306.1 RNA-binding protein [Marinitoga sp. 1135]NUU98224.1 RNA-binding protein [Marinitoga sp. 1138]
MEVVFVTKSTAFGETVKVTVKDIKKFGAFVTLESGEEGFIHISKISNDYVKNISDFLKVGQELEGKIIGKTKDGKVELSLKTEDAQEEKKDEEFEKKLSRFLKDSDRKLSEYSRRLDKKRGGKGRR